MKRRCGRMTPQSEMRTTVIPGSNLFRRSAVSGAAAVALLVLVSSLGAQQATGRIIGRVVSTQTGEPVPSVQVFVQGTSSGSLTDAGGRFVLTRVPAGVHSVTAQTLGYASKTVTDVEVPLDGSVVLDISIAPDAVALEGIVVSAERERGNTSALLSERMRAPVVVDAIGAEQIGRSPDGDAAEVLKRVPGVSVVDGQFVYVRGLGERYGATTLNGAPMPSPIPDKKAVPLDVIPSSLLESVVTAKTYSPDQPGDYAGGLVQIETRSVPRTRSLRLSSSVGYNTAASLQAANSAAGGGLDFVGFDNGARELPGNLLAGGSIPVEPGPDFAAALTRRFAATESDAPLNQSYGITYGDEVFVGDNPVGLVGTLSLSNSYNAPQNSAERAFTNDLGGTPGRDVDFDVEAGGHETALGTLLSASFEVAPAQRITATATYNRLAEDQSRIFSGPYENVAPYVVSYQTRYIANSIANLQLRGEHLLRGMGGLSARWRASYGRAERDEPGTRNAVYAGSGPQQPTFFVSTSSSGLVFAQELNEDLGSTALDLKLPFTLRALPASLAFGGSGDLRDRSVLSRRLFLQPVGGIPGEIARLTPEELFVPERIGSQPGDFEVRDRTFPEDNFNADQTTVAGYAMIDAEILPKLRAVAGARMEWARQNVETRASRSPVGGTLLENVDILPALNLTYAVSPSVNLRGAVSRTIARPEFRERASFLYEDFFGGIATRGNPFLEQASILNYDLRGEYFAPGGALLSVGGFFKHFNNPIEPIFFNLGANRGQSFANSESARLFGAELELRSRLGFLTTAFENLEFNANLTLARSAVEGDSVALLDVATQTPRFFKTSRKNDKSLFNQSPYVINLGLSYFQPASGTTATLLFNRFARRLDARGINELPDVYEEGRSQLDLIVEQPLRSGLSVKLAAERLLGGEIEFTQRFANGETVTTRQYDPGQTFSLSLAWEPWGR